MHFAILYWATEIFKSGPFQTDGFTLIKTGAFSSEEKHLPEWPFGEFSTQSPILSLDN